LASLSLQISLLISDLGRKRGEVFHNWRGAIRGYDPVAYFTKKAAVKGDKSIYVDWKGARWYFVSADNRNQFASAPEKFAPQFGGFCAWGVRNGYKIHTDPCCWTIYNDKLYLNYSEAVQQKWRADPEKYIAVAAEKWGRLKGRY